MSLAVRTSLGPSTRMMRGVTMETSVQVKVVQEVLEMSWNWKKWRMKRTKGTGKTFAATSDSLSSVWPKRCSSPFRLELLDSSMTSAERFKVDKKIERYKTNKIKF